MESCEPGLTCPGSAYIKNFGFGLRIGLTYFFSMDKLGSHFHQELRAEFGPALAVLEISLIVVTTALPKNCSEHCNHLTFMSTATH